MQLKLVVKIITIIDVLLAAVLISIYVYILSNNLEEIKMEKRSKRDHIIVYVYVCVSILIQITFAFKFFRVLSIESENDDEDENIEDQIRVAKYWLITGYLLLFNFIIKTGVYSQRCSCIISLTLVLYIFAILFRIFAIYVVNSFVTTLEKAHSTNMRKVKISNILEFHKRFHHHSHYNDDDDDDDAYQSNHTDRRDIVIIDDDYIPNKQQEPK